ncbi:hypothetical protein OCT63_17045 [Vibrio sp. RW]|uniref:hypothetical protein n=1 Tax=Vibrio sp. RW TaxID=2998833 RepID=UPI0022CDB445|nr:hypothetical protein [Vibrio sp. RW]MDA0145934.1 hypothetical protein [Vibrio sp. RW]
MSKPKMLTVSLLVLLTSHGLTFWAGQYSNRPATDNVSLQFESLKPSKNQADNACYLSYMREAENVPNKSIQLVDVKGKWVDVSSSFLCAIKGWHQLKHDSGLIEQTSEETFFVLKEEFVIKPISEAEFKKMYAQ